MCFDDWGSVSVRQETLTPTAHVNAGRPPATEDAIVAPAQKLTGYRGGTGNIPTEGPRSTSWHSPVALLRDEHPARMQFCEFLHRHITEELFPHDIPCKAEACCTRDDVFSVWVRENPNAIRGRGYQFPSASAPCCGPHLCGDFPEAVLPGLLGDVPPAVIIARCCGHTREGVPDMERRVHGLLGRRISLR
jgi:hypothetical protein